MEPGDEVALICEKPLQGVRGELLHRQLGHERQLKGRVRRVRDHGREKLPWVSREHTEGESWTKVCRATGRRSREGTVSS